MITFTKTANSVEVDLGNDIHYLSPSTVVSAKASSNLIYLSESPSPATAYFKFAPTEVNGRSSDDVLDVAIWLRDNYFTGLSLSGLAGGGPIEDGASAVKATVFDYTNSNPLAVRLTDLSGNYITAGGGTQYTEGDVDTTITGTALMMEGASNTLVAAPGTSADGLLVNLGSNNDVTVTNTVSVTGSLTIDTTGLATSTKQDTGNTSLSTIAGAVSGTEMQVDVLTMPTTTVQATNLDIRDLVFASDKVDISGSTLAANSGVDIGDVTINNGTGVNAVNIQDGGNSITVDGTVTANISGSISNTSFTVNNTSGASAVNIQDGGNSITVDAPVATPVFVRLSDGAAAISALPITDNNSSLTVDYATTGSGTSTGALRVELPTNGTGTISTVSTVTSLTQMNGQAIAMGTGTRSAGTQRVTIATDDIVPSSQSGTWTVQPGNTANTTPWLVRSTSTTPSQSSTSVTTASTSLLASNSNRKGATLYNESGSTCYVKLGSTASTSSYSCQIALGGYYEVPYGYTGAIDGITSTGTSQLRITEIV